MRVIGETRPTLMFHRFDARTDIAIFISFSYIFFSLKLLRLSWYSGASSIVDSIPTRGIILKLFLFSQDAMSSKLDRM